MRFAATTLAPTATPTRLPTGSLGYWYTGTVNGVTVGLTTTVVSTAWGVEYATTPDGSAKTGAIVVINGQTTQLVLNTAGDYWCYSLLDISVWVNCTSQYIGVYDCLFVNTDFYTQSRTCSPTAVSPTGPLAVSIRPSPAPGTYICMCVMCVCVCVCLCVCLCLYIHMCVRVCFVCLCVCMRNVCICMYVCLFVCMYVCIYLSIYLPVYLSIDLSMPTYIHTYIHTHIDR
jgi:hypothetical protein